MHDDPANAPDPWRSIDAIRTGIDAGAFGVRELVEAALSRSEALDPQLRAWSHLWPERARARADRLDALPADRRGPLHGALIAAKDLCDVRGEPTHAGTTVLGDRPAGEDATVVRRLEEAGALVLGQVKMTEGAFAAHHPSVAPPINPHNRERWTGISSSGSGVAVAAGLCTAALGTDTGGSIRFPSSACGVVGLKPTHGRVSLAGVFPLSASLDHIGPMARSVADVERLFEAMAGPDERDSVTLRAHPPAPRRSDRAPSARGLRIGLDPVYFEGGVDPEIAAAVARVVEALQSEGATTVRIEMPPVDTLLSAWVPICSAEAALAHAETFPARRADYGPELAGMLDVGLALGGRDIAEAWLHRVAYTRQMAGVFEACDVLICPGLAVRFAADTNLGASDAPPGATTAMRFTLPFNLTGVPSLTLPCGLDHEGAPIGVQLVGPDLSESRLLELGALLETRGTCRTPRPPIDRS